jgi:hypothetical protein
MKGCIRYTILKRVALRVEITHHIKREGTLVLLIRVCLISSQDGPIKLRLIMKCSNALVLAPKTWLKVSPLRSAGKLGTVVKGKIIYISLLP